MTDIFSNPALWAVGFGGFWCLVSYGLALAGWRRLVPDFASPTTPAGLTLWLSYVSLDSVQYKGLGVVRATVTAEGLGLGVLFLFRVGHPPLLIPWSAIGPVTQTSHWWGNTQQTTIRTSSGRQVEFQFRNERLFEALQQRQLPGRPR